VTAIIGTMARAVMHAPKRKADLTLLRQLDHVYGRRVAAFPA
jgi:hypothetical protein